MMAPTPMARRRMRQDAPASTAERPALANPADAAKADAAAPAESPAVARALAAGVDAAALAALLGLGNGAVPRAQVEAALLAPAREILARPAKHVRARLVDVGWRAAGGPGPAPVALGLAVEILHAGSLVVDDVEDGSFWRRGGPALHELVGVPLAVNTGSFLCIWPFALLRQIGLPPGRELDCTRRLSDTLVRCHAGQALDLGVVVDALPPAQVRGIVCAATELKTGALVELALSLPAAALGAVGAAEALGACGRELGVALQMLDDLGNLAGERAPEKLGEDLRHGRPAWPWAWLAEEAERFAGFAARARAARAGEERLDALARDLLAEVHERGRAEASARMRAALHHLEEQLGRPTGATDALRDVVRTLEAAYV